MICCGFGHRVMLMDVEKPLREVLEWLVEERGVRVFYTGGMGEFDCEHEHRGRFSVLFLLPCVSVPGRAEALPGGVFAGKLTDFTR